jgi:hypothetical protein
MRNKKNRRYVTFEDWKLMANKEVENGHVLGKLREKFVTVEERVVCL